MLLAASVGEQTQPVSVTILLSASGVATAPQALTQGVAGVDFSVVNGGTCAPNASYVSGQQCTVDVVFAPKYPGLRVGAVVLISTNGSLLGSSALAGMATGSLSVLYPGIINTLAGDGELEFRADGVLATQAPIFLPYGVIVDPAGNIYLSDTNNNRVRRVDAQSGLISTIAGNGASGYSGDGGPATQANISQPGGLVMDGAGNIFFADSGNHIVRRIDAVSGILTTVAGVPVTFGYSGDGLAATSANLSTPRGVAFDAAGNLYIADTGNNAIREVSATTGLIITVAGTGAAGYNGDGILATGALLNSPWTVSVAADNSLYIADLANNRIRKVAAGLISTVVGTGTRGFAGDTGAAVAAELSDPASVILDPAGNLYIADSGNDRVRMVFANTGIIETLAGNASEEFAGDLGPANLAGLYAPYALFFDEGGNLFVADTLHNRIRRIYATPFPLSYPVMRVGKTSVPQVEGLENDGNANLILSAPILNNAALDPATSCSFTAAMAPSAVCDLDVDFMPTVVGTLVPGSVTLNSNAGNGPAVIDLSGQVLSVEPTAVSLASSANPDLVGQSVTFTATVATDNPTPSGPVTFLDGTTPLCSNVNLNASSAACTLSTLTLGQHSITASYAGDNNDAASVSPALLQVVKQQPTLALAVAPNPMVVTQSVTLTLTATASTGTPSGLVVFYDGATALSGNVSLNAFGIASFSTTQLTPGEHSLSVQYAGDATNASGPSNTVTEVVTQISTTTTIASSSSTANTGTPVTFTATVNNLNGPTPTGTIQFMAAAVVLGMGAVDGNGHATLTLSTLAPGAYSIIATYSGDIDNSGSSSTALTETIQQIPTTTVLTSDTNPAGAGATIHLTATIGLGTGASPDGAITGVVTFSEGTTIYGTAPVNSSSGVAILALSTLSVGRHNLTATYAGNTNYAANASSTLVETVTSTATTTLLTTGGTSSLSGKPLTLTASVASATGIPGGNVFFENAGVTIGQGALNAQGVATFSTASLPVGMQTLTAVYQGNGSYIASNSAPMVESVALATAGLTLAGPANAVTVGIPVSFTAALTGNGVAPTGALMLHDGSAVIATQNVTGVGTFTFSISTLAIGAHSLTATYAGDGNNSPALSNAIAVTVQQAATTSSLISSANPSVVGQSVTLTAAVTSTGANITGSVSFEDGGVVIGSIALGGNGTATFNTSSLSFGVHTLTAVYSGDTNHTASTASAIAEQIVQAASAALTSSVNPSTAGAPTVFAVKLTGVGSLIPTGTATFSDGAASLATMVLDATGSASFSTASLTVGSHSITVKYSGDTNYQTTSSTLIQTVQSASTQITLTSSANPATYETTLVLTSTVISNGGVATGTVSFSDGGTSIGSGILNTSGVATLSTSSLAPAPHSIVANYAGDGKASPSTSTPLTLSVLQRTSIALASSVNPASTLSPIVLTAAVTNSGVTPITGTVTFSDGATQLGTAAVDATGHATLTLPSLSAGSHTMTATYAGDTNDFSSVSAALSQSVQLLPTTTALTASSTDLDNPQQVTLIGIVRWTGPAVPTGMIVFTQGSAVIGSSPINLSGAATINIVIQDNSTETIVATYIGDASYATSASPAVAVVGGPAAQFTLSLNPSSITIQSTQHVVVTLTAASVNSFADTLQFGCLGLPYAASCTFSSVQTGLAANGSSTVQLTIDTGDPLGAGSEVRNQRTPSSNILLCFLPGSVLAGLALFYRRRIALQGLLLLLFAAAIVLPMTGCSGLHQTGTPAGAYAFKVTASGQGTGATESQVMNLTVTP